MRIGAKAAVVEGRITVPADAPAAVRAQEAGAELDDGALLVSRTISAEGRSRAHVGGRSVPVGLLAELADDLVAVHGQTDQQGLLRPARQRQALDRYAGDAVAVPHTKYTAAYRRLRSVVAELDELTTRARERAQEADLLRFGLDEIAAVEPRADEDVELAAEAERLGHAEALASAAAVAHAALVGNPEDPESVDATTLVAGAHRALDAVRAHDPALAALAERIGEIGILLGDVAGELAGYADDLDADPLRLSAVEERRAALTQLTRKYGEDIRAVLAWAQDGSARLTELEGDDDRIGELTAERDALREELAGLAQALTDARTEAAKRFADAVTEELASLAMPHARVTIDVRQAEDPEGIEVGGRLVAYGASGADEVELLLGAAAPVPSPGRSPRALRAVSSRG